MPEAGRSWGRETFELVTRAAAEPLLPAHALPARGAGRPAGLVGLGGVSRPGNQGTPHGVRRAWLGVGPAGRPRCLALQTSPGGSNTCPGRMRADAPTGAKEPSS